MTEWTEEAKLQLIEMARQVARNAYAPYSNFPVGAALQDGEGNIYLGVNVENASYGLTSCAERNALFQGIAAGAKSFSALALAAGTKPTMPCGACRQVLAEFNPDLPLFLSSLSGKEIIERRLSQLLPDAFDLTEKEVGS